MEGKHRLGGSQEQSVATATRKEFDLGICLALVCFEAHGQLGVVPEHLSLAWVERSIRETPVGTGQKRCRHKQDRGRCNSQWPLAVPLAWSLQSHLGTLFIPQASDFAMKTGSKSVAARMSLHRFLTVILQYPCQNRFSGWTTGSRS